MNGSALRGLRVFRVAGALVAGAAVAAAAGCSSSGGSSSPAASATAPTVTASPSAAAHSAAASPAVTPQAVPPGGSSASGGGPGGAAACATRDLQVKAGTAEGAAGSVYQAIDFTNASSAACTLYGFPGVSLATGSPATQVGAAAARSTTDTPTVVTLAPGQTANAELRIVQAGNYAHAACAPANTTYLQVYPPNQTKAVLLPFKSTGCTSGSVKLLTIGVVKAGAGQ